MKTSKDNTQVKIALHRASEVNVVGTAYLADHPGIDKITFAVQRILNQTNKQRIFDSYTNAKEKHENRIRSLEMKYANTEEGSPKLLLDANGDKTYTKENHDLLTTGKSAEREDWQKISQKELSATIDVTTHIVDNKVLLTSSPELTMEFIDTFDGLILDAESLYSEILNKESK